MATGKTVNNLLLKSFSRLISDDLIIDFPGTAFAAKSSSTEVIDVPSGAILKLDEHKFSSLDEYLDLYGSQAYNALFFDYAFIQINAFYRSNRLCEYRYSYYSCPFDLESLQSLGAGPIEFADLIGPGQFSHLKLRTSFRFEYAPQDARAYHPASHLHVNSPSVRIGLGCILSPGSFLRFILETFYSGYWERIEHHWAGIGTDDPCDLEQQDRLRLFLSNQ